MKTLKKLIFSAVLVLAVLSFLTTSFLCLAASDNGSITVELLHEEQFIEDGFCVYLSKIADYEDGDYKVAKGFKETKISISQILENPTEKNAKEIENFVLDNELASYESASKNGIVRFNDIESGIWLVYCKQGEKYTFNPYFVFLPFLNDGKAEYNVKTMPKISENSGESISIYILKKWDDSNKKAKKRPHYVTVELKLDGKTVDTAMLSKENGWEHTFSGLENGDYSIKEKSVKNYTARYEGDSKNGFVITNVYNDGKLPQTGQLWWPVVILLVAGIGFMVLGIIEIGVKKNAKKTK